MKTRVPRRKAARRKPARRKPATRRKPARAGRRPAGARRDTAAVLRARRGLDQAAQALASRAAELARVADDIAAAAVEKERTAIADELASERILRDVLELREALAAAPAGSLGDALEVLRKLPDAVLEWMARRLGLAPYLAPDEEMEVPADRLAAFDLEGPAPRASGLVRLRVLAAGWKRHGRVVVRPQVVRAV